MLGSRPRIAALAACSLFVPATALAKQDGYYIYSYSKPKLGLSAQLVQQTGKALVTANISQQCAGPDDTPVTVSANLSGNVKNGKIDLKGPAPDGGQGKARIQGTLADRKFSGKLSVRVPIDGAGTCKVAQRVSLKGTFTTGG